MNDNLAKQIGDKKSFSFYRPNIIAGKYMGYDCIIKYDSNTLTYNMDIYAKGDKSDELNKIIKKINKDIVIKDKKNGINIIETCNDKKDLPTLINKIIDVIIDFLKKNKYKAICMRCGLEKPTTLVDYDGLINYCCEDCYKELEELVGSTNAKKDVKERTGLGIIGMLIGFIPGIILWIILSLLKVDTSIAACAIMLGGAFGYKILAKTIKIKGLIITLVMGFLAIFVMNEVSYVLVVYNKYKEMYLINYWDAYKALPYYFDKIVNLKTNYNHDLLWGNILALFGALGNFGLYYQSQSKAKLRKLG